MNKIAVVLCNLGSPGSVEEIKPFLFNLFYDKAIIRLPFFLRWPFAKLFSIFRFKKASMIYESIGGKSPLIAETFMHANNLQDALSNNDKNDFKVFTCMRYSKPFIKDVMLDIEKYDPNNIVLFPMYPQCSTTTTVSFFDEWNSVTKSLKLAKVNTNKICCMFHDNLYLNVQSDLVRDNYHALINTSNGLMPKILFSAHGIPISCIKRGDPYEWQINETVRAVADNLKITENDFIVCYQSKVGANKWLEPNLNDELISAAKSGRPVLVVPIAFVAENSETVEELDIRSKKLFVDNGGSHYLRAPVIGNHISWTEVLRNMILSKLYNNEIVSSMDIICRNCFSACPCRSE